MTNDRVYNFSAGPSMLPLTVLEKAASEMTNYRGSGMSVTEMSHRSAVYQAIFDEVKADLKRILCVPDTHEIIFMQGGATFQFSAVPMNLIGKTGSADYAITGNFSSLAAKEAKKYGNINVIYSTEDCGHVRIPTQDELRFSDDASYFYYCSNNTIYGTEWHYTPDCGKIPLVSDMSSDILSAPVDVSKYGIIYGGVQKNMAPAGMAVVIIRRDLLDGALPYTPVIMDYATNAKADSMYNTPPCYNIYMLGLVLKWVEENGGLSGMEKLRDIRSSMLYDFIDESKMFHGRAEKAARSKMNVTFRTDDADLDAKFIKEATAKGFVNLKGHRIAGGMRASIYNAMPVDGAKELVAFMKQFEMNNR